MPFNSLLRVYVTNFSKIERGMIMHQACVSTLLMRAIKYLKHKNTQELQQGLAICVSQLDAAREMRVRWLCASHVCRFHYPILEIPESDSLIHTRRYIRRALAAQWQSRHA